MGFDNECVVNIQSLPGEYFCPVCRTLVYPNEALQSQCTHLYCKPCLAYIVATTQACPYDGYLVTEADSKPLMESNKSLAETIGKVTVHCLYHRSGCQWQGTLSDCITHGTSCAFGNSPVVCNRCGTQIIHRQVQEHAQICPGLQPHAQHAESAQVQSSAVTTQVANQDPSAAASVAPAAAVTAAPATTVATTGAPATAASAAVATAAAPAGAPAAAGQVQAIAQTSTAEQWYQQQLQYQQYYQQYPGYNPYTQYQQYGQYQQAYQQYGQPQMQVTPQHSAHSAIVQPSPYVQSQPQVQQPGQLQTMVQAQPHPQPYLQPQPQAQAVQPQPQQQQPQPQPPMQPQPQVQQMQAPQPQVPSLQPPPQAQLTAHAPPPAQVAGQPFGQTATQALHSQLQPHAQPQQQQQLQPPPHQQQALAHQQHPQSQPPHMQPLPQQQSHAQPLMQPHPQIQHQQPHMQLQPHPQPQAYPLPQPMPHAQPQNPSARAVTGHQSYPQAQQPPQAAHQMPPAAPQQRPVHMNPQQQGVPYQHPQQPVQMRPSHGQFPVQGQQPPVLPLQGPHANVQHQPHHLAGHHAQQVQSHPGIPPQPHQQGFPPQQTSAPLQGMPLSQQQMHPQQALRPQGPPYMQQHAPSQGMVGHQTQTSAVRPMSHGMPPQQFQQLPAGGPVKHLQPGIMNQPPPMLRSSSQGAVQQPTGQGSLAPVSPASQPGKSGKTANSQSEGAELNKLQEEGVGSAGAMSSQSEPTGNEKMNGDSKESELDKVHMDATESSQGAAMGIESDKADGLNKNTTVKEGVGARHEGGDSHDLEDVQGDSETKSIDGKTSDKSGVQAAREDAAPIVNAPGDLERGSIQQPSQHNIGPGSHVVQGMGPVVPPQQLPYGHPPNLSDAFQRPPGPDRMVPYHMPHPGPTQERRFPEPLPYHMQAQRPDMLTNQMRPPGHNFPENIRPSPMQQPHGSYHSEVPPRAPGQLYGQSQNNMPMPQPGGIRPHGENMIRPAMGGPLPRVFDPRGPPFTPEQVGRPRASSNTLEPEANASGFFDGRQAEPPFVHSGMGKMNGVGGGPLAGGVPPLHEEGFNSAAGEHRKPFPAYPGRRNVTCGEIEEDLKQFPRPAHLDNEGLPRTFERTSGRPFFPYQPGGPFPTGNVGSEQHPLDYGERHRPMGFHEDFGRKPNAAAGHPEYGRHRMDGMPPLRSPGNEYAVQSSRFGLGNQSYSEDFNCRDPREFGHFLRGMPDGPGGLRKEQFGPSNLPGNSRNDPDGPDVPHARFHPGDSFGPRSLHGGVWHGGDSLGQGPLRGIEPSGYGGGYTGHMHPGDPGFGSNYSRNGFPNEAGHFGAFSLHGEMDTFGHPRKRSMGWCRICRIDCETPAGLDLHAQTREHQKAAMDVVLKMKQEVAKKRKLNSDGPKSFDDKKAVGKANHSGRGNRH